MTTHSQVLKEMQEARDAIKLGEAMERLQKNRDFKTVFHDNLFKDRILDIVSDLHLYEATSPEHKDVVAELESISRTKAYLTSLITKGQCAEADLEAAQNIPDSELI